VFIIGYVLHLLHMPLPQYFQKAWRTPLMAAALPACVWWPLSANTNDWTWIKLFGFGFAGLLPYAALVAVIEWQARSRSRNVVRRAA
jgi:hypothetical protein